MVVSVTTAPTLRIGPLREALREPFYFDPAGSPRAQYDVSADGQRFLLLKEPERAAADRAQIVIVEHWFEDLTQRVPRD